MTLLEFFEYFLTFVSIIFTFIQGNWIIQHLKTFSKPFSQVKSFFQALNNTGAINKAVFWVWTLLKVFNIYLGYFLVKDIIRGGILFALLNFRLVFWWLDLNLTWRPWCIKKGRNWSRLLSKTDFSLCHLFLISS